MPKTIIPKKTARRTRKGFKRGQSKKEYRRKGRPGNKASSPSVIANSIFALTLRPKYGYEVAAKLSGESSPGFDDFPKMYRDLLEATKRGLKLVKNETTRFDPLASGFEIGESFAMVVSIFKSNILPKGYDFNIDGGDGSDYYFTIYKEVDFPYAWHTFEIKTVVKHLAASNKRLHDLFIDVISTFYKKTGIDTWWESALGWAEYQLEDIDEMLNCQFDFESEEEREEKRKELKALQECYQKGEAKKYASLIRGNKYISPEDLLVRISRFNQKDPVVIWMKAACEFLKKDGSISDFVYEELEHDMEGVRLEQQSAIIWDYDDYMYDLQADSLDSEANGCGVMPAYINFPVTKTNRFIDLGKLPEREKWLMEFSRIQIHCNKMINKIKNGHKNANADE